MAGTNSDSDVRWTAAQQPGLADQRLHMWGSQESKMSAKQWSRRKALSQWKYFFVSIENANAWKCILLSTSYMHGDHQCISMYELHMDHDWSNSWAWTSHPLQGIGSRRLKTSPGICHAFWEPNRNVDQRWFRFNWLLLEPDKFLTATVLCRRLSLFGCLTLGISPSSPGLLPDPVWPDDVRAGSFLNMHLPCQCTISTDGVYIWIDFQDISWYQNRTEWNWQLRG